jgi:hypothetical protein
MIKLCFNFGLYINTKCELKICVFFWRSQVQIQDMYISIDFSN